MEKKSESLGDARISKYFGTCYHCGLTYNVGDEVYWNARVKGTVCHYRCYQEYGLPTIPRWLKEGKEQGE